MSVVRRSLMNYRKAFDVVKFQDSEIKKLYVFLYGGSTGGYAANNTRVSGRKIKGIDGELTIQQCEDIKELFKDIRLYLRNGNYNGSNFYRDNIVTLIDLNTINSYLVTPCITFGTLWDMFADCANLEYADFSFITDNYGNRTLTNCPKLAYIGDINAQTIGIRVLEPLLNLEYVVLNNATTIGHILGSTNNVTKFVILNMSVMPTAPSDDRSFNNKKIPIYVPNAMVDVYKADSTWATYKIRALSDLPTDFPNVQIN